MVQERIKELSPKIIEQIGNPGTLVTVRPEDFVGNRYDNCRDCALCRAIRRVTKDGVDVTVARGETGFDGVNIHRDKHPDTMAMDGFGGGPQTFSFYLDIPQEFLKETP